MPDTRKAHCLIAEKKEWETEKGIDQTESIARKA